MKEFPIGSQWKTRGGWRAVVVGKKKGFMQVWHEPDACSWDHYVLTGNSEESDCQDGDLIEPWQEPVVHEGWILIKKKGYEAHFYTVKQTITVRMREDYLAQVKIPPFTEGEGL